LLAYLGIFLTWFHQIPTGNELVVDAAAAAYWTGLYLGTAGLMVLFRLLQPVLWNTLHGLKVESVTPENSNTVSLRLTGRKLNRLHVQPGQFFIWRFLTRGRWHEAHAFSLSAAPNDSSLRITAKDLGDFSRHMGEIKPGTRVIAEGPFGHFTAAAARTDRIALIAGGIGITPIRAMLEQLTGDVTLIYRAISDDDLVFRAEIDTIARERGFTVHYVTGDHRVAGNERLLTPDHLRDLVPDIAERDVYICGPTGLATFLLHNVERAGVPAERIHFERFALV
jgi:ferredoxin-NADP reductase